jgi:hypothetical protein
MYQLLEIFYENNKWFVEVSTDQFPFGIKYSEHSTEQDAINSLRLAEKVLKKLLDNCGELS